MFSNTILFLIVSVFCLTFHADDCQTTKYKESPCKDGEKNLEVTYYVKETNGTCRADVITRRLPCVFNTTSTKDCECEAFGSPSVVTFDESIFTFSSGCAYTLVAHSGEEEGSSKCNFEIVGISDEKTHTLAAIEVYLRGSYIQMGQDQVVKVNDEITHVPEKVGADIEVFVSNGFMKVLSPQCGVDVSFDGKSRAIIALDRSKYSNSTEGICGNCNRIKDDLKDRTNIDLSNEEHGLKKFVESWISIEHTCEKPYVHIEEEDCKPSLKKSYLENKDFCGLFSTENTGKFYDVMKTFDMAAYSKSCVEQMCRLKEDFQSMTKLKCSMVETIIDLAIMKNQTIDFDWRSETNCMFTCGRNQEYTNRGSPCCKTCEEKFFGENPEKACPITTNLPSCRCKDGYVLDGSVCVKPEKCQCLELCEDNSPTEKCQQWKKEGRCEEFQAAMNVECRLTCEFCKKKSNKCVDSISAESCAKFRKEGKCSDSFYGYMCGLTCNEQTCPCAPKQVKEENCDEHKVKKIYTTEFNRVDGVCMPNKTETLVECGECSTAQKVVEGECNVCTGTRKNKITFYERDPKTKKCIFYEKETVASCTICKSESVKKDICKNNAQSVELITTHRPSDDCRECKVLNDEKQKPVTCPPKVETMACSDKCLKDIITTEYEVKECKCLPKNPTTRTEECCCLPRPNTTTCKDNTLIVTKYSSDLVQGRCIYTPIVENSTFIVAPKDKVVPGLCADGFKTDTITKFTVNECAIRNQTINEKVECPLNCGEAKNVTECNAKSNLLETYSLYAIEIKRNCVNQKKLVNSTKPECKEDVKEKDGQCDTLTCNKEVTITRNVLENCECTPVKKEVTRPCCCKPTPPVVSCKGDSIETTVTTMALENDKCVVSKSLTTKKAIECPEKKMNEKACVLGQQLVDIEYYEVVNCECVKRQKTISKKCQLVCPEDTKSESECDKESCRKTITKTLYKIENDKCISWFQHDTEVCCHKEDKIEKSCDKSTGRVVIQTTKYQPKLETLTSYQNLNCTMNEVAEEKADLTKIHFKKITRTFEVENRENCSCTVKQDVSFKRTSCPPVEQPKPACNNDKEIITTKLSVAINEKTDGCDIKEEKHREVLACPAPNDTSVVKTCENCRVQLHYFENKAENCECKLKKVVKDTDENCCCPEPTFTKTCSDNQFIMVNVTYDKDPSGKCFAQKNSTTEKVVCPTDLDPIGDKVTTKNCTKTTESRSIYIENCKCQLSPWKIKTEQICCPQPEVEITCDDTFKMIRNTSYLLKNGTCEEQKTEDKTLILCPTIQSLEGPCLKETKKKMITITDWVVDKKTCSCVEKKTIETRNCGIECKTDEFVNEEKSNYTEIYKVINEPTFVNGSFVCTANKTLFEIDYKTCPKTSVSVTCHNETLVANEVTTTTNYRLEKSIREGVEYGTCKKVESVNSISYDQICGRKLTAWTDCSNFTQTKKDYTPVKNECSCKEITLTKSCMCELKNYKTKQCVNGTQFEVFFDYTSGGEKCEEKIEKKEIPQSCPAEEKKESACNVIEGKHKMKYITRVYYQVNDKTCNCDRFEKREKVICGCIDDTTEAMCKDGIRTNNLIRYELRDNTTCSVEVKKNPENNECETPSIQVSACDESTCLETVTLTKFHKDSNCKCQKNTVKKSRACCCKEKTEAANRAGFIDTVNKDCNAGKEVEEFGSYELQEVDSPLFPKHSEEYKEKICVLVQTKIENDFFCDPRERSTFTCSSDTETSAKVIEWTMPACCKCVKKQKMIGLAGCSCKPSSLNYTKCENGKYEQITTDYIFQKDECVPVESRSVKFCECPKPHMQKYCEGGVTKYIETSYLLAHGDCVEIKKTKSYKFNYEAFNNGAVSKIVYGQCDSNSTREITTTKKFYDEDTCLFRAVERKTSAKCSCPECKKISSSCSAFGHQVVDKFECYNLNEGKCDKYIKEVNNEIECDPTETIEVGNCNTTTGHSIVKVFKKAIENCQCSKSALPTIKQCSCNTDGSVNFEKCVVKDEESKNVFTKALETCKSNITEAECNYNKAIVKKSCHVGSVSYRIMKDVMNLDAGTCKCSKVEQEDTCDCQCQENITKKECSPFSDKIITKIVTGEWVDNCKCNTKEKIDVQNINCPIGKTITKGSCANGVANVTTTVHIMDYSDCECKAITETLSVNCTKDNLVDNVSIESTCKPDGLTLVEKKVKEVDVNGKSVKTILSVSEKHVKCPEPKVELNCTDGAKNGKLKRIIQVPVNCQCVQKVEETDVQCGCFDNEVLIEEGTCSDNCTAINTYRFGKRSADGKTCTNEDTKRTAACCCLAKPEVRTKCSLNVMTKTTINQRLDKAKGFCTDVKEIHEEIMTCPQNPNDIVEETCDKVTGYQKVHYYNNVLQEDCTCKRVLSFTKDRKCMCPEETVVQDCQSASEKIIVNKIKYSLQDDQCVSNVEKSTVATPKCKGTSSIKKDCDPATGLQIIEYTNEFLNSTCQCETKTRVKQVICACLKKPMTTVECLPDLSILQKNTTEILIDNTCQKIELRIKRDVKCTPTEWTPVDGGKGSCGANVKFFRRVNKDCKCVREEREMPCPCKCDRPNTKTCEDEMIKTISYFGKVVNCTCSYEQSFTKDNVNCPAKTVERGECDLTTCKRPITTFTFAPSKCECIKTPQIEYEKCCCGPAMVNDICDKNSNELIHKKITNDMTNNGGCAKKESLEFEPVTCPAMDISTDCTELAACKNGKRRLRCVSKVLKDCNCVDKTDEIEVDCTCQSAQVAKGVCDPNTCVRTNIITSYSGKDCSPLKTEEKEVCCCLGKEEVTTECSGDTTQVKTTTREVLKDKKCVKVREIVNESIVCDDVIETNSCDETCRTTALVTFFEPFKCKCRLKGRRRSSALCCCPYPDQDDTKCIGPDIRETTMTRYELTADKLGCHKLTNIKRLKLTCRDPVILENPCDITTCVQIIYRLFWTPENCLCKGGAQRKFKKCCDLHGAFETKICDEESGILSTNSYVFKIDEATGKQKREAEVTKTEVVCPKPEVQEGSCSIKNEAGFYQKEIKTKTYVRVGCECIPSESVRREICSCKQSEIRTTCKDDSKMVQIDVSYTLNKGDCEKIEKEVKTEVVQCPQPSEEKSACQPNGFQTLTRTTYKIANCICYPHVQTTNLRCSCPKAEKQSICTLTALVERTISYEMECSTPDHCECKKNVVEEVAKNSEQLDEKIEFGECINDKRKISKTIYETESCDCRKKVQEYEIGCKDCVDYYDKNECSKMVTDGRCLSLTHSKNCQKTCGYCFKWEKTNKKNVKITQNIIPGADINVPDKLSKDVTIDRIPLYSVNQCLRECETSDDCTSIAADFILNECRLYRPNLDTLTRAGITDVLFYKRDVYFAELQPVHDCQHTTIKTLTPCKCDSSNVCTQDIEVTHLKPSSLKGCRAKVIRKTAICPAINLIDSRECSKLAKEGKCNDTEVVKNCGFQCDQTIKLKCNKKISQELCENSTGVVNGTSTLVVKESFMTIDHGFCRVEEKTRKTNITCDAKVVERMNTEFQVGECFHGQRMITTLNFKNNLTIAEEKLNCENCCPSASHDLSPCENGERILTIDFFENKNNCCVKKTLTNKYKCYEHCPVDEVIPGICNYGKRLESTLFYVAETCITKQFHNTVDCSLPID